MYSEIKKKLQKLMRAECVMSRRKRLLMLLKPLDVYPSRHNQDLSRVKNPHVFEYLDNRCMVHKNAINYCQDVVRRKLVDWESIFRSDLSKPITGVDLVVTVGGDGTLLQASHLMDDSVPVLGVNSDPTQSKEVEEFSDEFDATRSTGYLCGATTENFELVLDNILEGHMDPLKLSRMAINLNSQPISTYALNDILVAHSCPATVSRFSFRIESGDQPASPLINCRSSGLRVSTAAGSTAAMLSAGGHVMPILSRDLQYMVREPIAPASTISHLLHKFVRPDESMKIAWSCKYGLIYVDGSHVVYPIQHGDTIDVSSKAPVLNVFLPHLSHSSTSK
uniref:NADH kinase n=1 Tax=Kalanchoe fedtschenkoi TaxID=63787 RepID=A0A7N1A9B7_KALFE